MGWTDEFSYPDTSCVGAVDWGASVIMIVIYLCEQAQLFAVTTTICALPYYSLADSIFLSDQILKTKH
jgi:hypothetical protein